MIKKTFRLTFSLGHGVFQYL